MQDTQPMSNLNKLKIALKKQANPAKAKVMSSFFKTGEGGYAQGDRFLGITVPEQRAIAKQFTQLSLGDIGALLRSPIHEERLTALLILVDQFKKGDEKIQEKIYAFYLKNAMRINNWDLVDSSAHHIVGAYLDGKQKEELKRLACSKILWERRIAIVATWHDIRKGRTDTVFMIAQMLLTDEHDLMHKATGWMLREAGKHGSEELLEGFLKRHYRHMPRTMLRYAIERFPERKRQDYLKGLVQ